MRPPGPSGVKWLDGGRGPMQSSEVERCRFCSDSLIDVGEELVCKSCGAVTEKSVMAVPRTPEGKLPLFGKQPLGSFMGSKEITVRERHSRVSGDNTRYEKMKLIADHAGKEGSPADCGKLLERVGERLFLPRVVVMQAAAIAKKTMSAPVPGRRRIVAEVSAFALVAACKIEGVTSVSIREILAAYADLGKRVSSSDIFHLMLESQLRTFARTPEDYLSRVIAKLSMNRRLGERLRREGVLLPVYLGSLRASAAELLGECDGTALYGKRPCALAASATYAAEVMMASVDSRKLRLTQRECAECGDAAEYTVREQCSTVFMPLVSTRLSQRLRTLPPQTAR